jgi:hypothetical protein
MKGCPYHIKHDEQVYELNDVTEVLKNALSLLSKEQNNEAVEFSIWLSANEWVYLQNGSTFTHYVEGERDVLELYQIFKQRK